MKNLKKEADDEFCFRMGCSDEFWGENDWEKIKSKIEGKFNDIDKDLTKEEIKEVVFELSKFICFLYVYLQDLPYAKFVKDSLKYCDINSEKAISESIKTNILVDLNETSKKFFGLEYLKCIRAGLPHEKAYERAKNIDHYLDLFNKHFEFGLKNKEEEEGINKKLRKLRDL